MPQKVQFGEKSSKYFKTICLTAAFCSLGLCSAILGPCLPTLAYNLGVAEKSLSFIFTMRGCGYMLGAILSGLLFKKVNPYFLVGLCLTLTVVGYIAAPFMPITALLAALLLISGSSMGVLDTGGNVMCITLWGKESEPWMQTLHFFFAFGATLGPFVAKPFINDALVSDDDSTLPGISSNLSTPNASATGEADQDFPRVAWAFIIAACFSFTVAIGFYFLTFSKHKITKSCQENTIVQEGRKFRVKLLLLLFVFYLVYVGTEVTFGNYIYTFAIRCQRRYTKHSGALLNSLFWGAFAIGRFVSIFIAKFVAPRRMLMLDLLGTSLATTAMSLFPFYYDSAEWILWGAIALYGWSMASLFPSGISWAERYITMTEGAATVLVVGSSVGEMTLPLLLGHQISVDPMNLMYFSAGCSGVILLNSLVLNKVATSKGPRHSAGSDNIANTDKKLSPAEENILLPPSLDDVKTHEDSNPTGTKDEGFSRMLT